VVGVAAERLRGQTAGGTGALSRLARDRLAGGLAGTTRPWSMTSSTHAGGAGFDGVGIEGS